VSRLERVSEQPAPRITVTLPDGRTLDGHLHTRRQRRDGQWWYEVAVEVPAAAVQPVDGEDYDQVPTERAEPPEPRYVVDNALPPIDGKRRLRLHTAGCWAIPKGRPGTRVVENAAQARAMLQFDDTEVCGVCKPEP
jgi:hypothetical protein